MIQRYPVYLFFVFALFCMGTLPALAGNEDQDGAAMHSATSGRIGKDDLAVELPASVHKGSEAEIKISFHNLSHPRLKDGKGTITFIVNSLPVDVHFEQGEARMKHVFDVNTISIYCDDFHFEKEVHFSSFILLGLSGCAVVVIVAAIRMRRRKKA